MVITAKQAKQLRGKVLRFTYPTNPGEQVRCMEPWCVRVDEIEDREGTDILRGYDVARERRQEFECQFIEDVEDIAGIAAQRLRHSVRLIEREDAEKCEEVFQATTPQEAFAWIDEWMRDPMSLGVVMLPLRMEAA